MKSQIQKLYEISQKKERRIIGLMSGTSLDGLDMALCKIKHDGEETELEIEEFYTHSFADEYRSQIQKVFSKRQVDLQTLTGLHVWVAHEHAAAVLTALEHWKINPNEIDAIASHGQTIFHAPQRLTKDPEMPNSTLQIGDGDHIAVKTGIITLSDFRQKHLAAGGEGAPLVGYGDKLLFRDDSEFRILLNIGGIANFTFLPPKNSTLSTYATDSGPGNTLMNQYMQKHFDMAMDKNAELAAKGKVQKTLLRSLLSDPFFYEDFPKTTGPELFNLDYFDKCFWQSNLLSLAHEDVMYTLCEFSARSITDAIKKSLYDIPHKSAVYISGGGIHNPLLFEKIKQQLKGVTEVYSFQKLGMNPDAKEAALFALLANETLSGQTRNYGVLNSPNVLMGKISLPY